LLPPIREPVSQLFDGPKIRGQVTGERGLARIEPAEGAFVLFSAGAKQAALDALGDDDPDPNSVFTRIFVKTLTRPGLSLVDIAKVTQAEVKALASSVRHDQTPAYYDQIVGDFFLTRPGAVTPPTISPPSAPPAKITLLPPPTGVGIPPKPQTIRLPLPFAPTKECASADATRYCVSSVLPPEYGNSYGPDHLLDGASDTAWVPRNLPSSIGQWVTIDFAGDRFITAILIANGYQKSADIYAKNSRVKRIDVAFSDGSRASYVLADQTGTQTLKVDPPVKASWLQLTIAEIYPGRKYLDTAISSIEIQSSSQ
jgi:hypothetical protein